MPYFSPIVVHAVDDLGAGIDVIGGGGGGAGSNRHGFLAKPIDLVGVAVADLEMLVGRSEGPALIRDQGRCPILVGEGNPAAFRVLADLAVFFGNVMILGFGQRAILDPQHAFEEDIEACHDRRILALHAGIGNKRNGRLRLVFNTLLDGEDIVVGKGNLAAEDKALAIVETQGDGRCAGERGARGHRPQRLRVGQLHGGPIGADETLFGEIGIGRARWREQRDDRALRVGKLVVLLQLQVIELGAGQIDRAFEKRRVDGDAA